MTEKKDCSNCRFSSITKVSENVEAVFDENIALSDEEVDFFHCRHPNNNSLKAIGRTPILCALYDDEKVDYASEADAMIAKFEARMKLREKD